MTEKVLIVGAHLSVDGTASFTSIIFLTEEKYKEKLNTLRVNNERHISKGSIEYLERKFSELFSYMKGLK